MERLEVGGTPSKLKGLVYLGKKNVFDGRCRNAAQAGKTLGRLRQCKSPMTGLAVTTASVSLLMGKASISLWQMMVSVSAALQLEKHYYFPHKMTKSCLLPAVQGCNLSADLTVIFC